MSFINKFSHPPQWMDPQAGVWKDMNACLLSSVQLFFLIPLRAKRTAWPHWRLEWGKGHRGTCSGVLKNPSPRYLPEPEEKHFTMRKSLWIQSISDNKWGPGLKNYSCYMKVYRWIKHLCYIPLVLLMVRNTFTIFILKNGEIYLYVYLFVKQIQEW